MKLKIRRWKAERVEQVGFRTRSKTAGGRKVIKRKIKRSDKLRIGSAWCAHGLAGAADSCHEPGVSAFCRGEAQRRLGS